MTFFIYLTVILGKSYPFHLSHKEDNMCGVENCHRDETNSKVFSLHATTLSNCGIFTPDCCLLNMKTWGWLLWTSNREVSGYKGPCGKGLCLCSVSWWWCLVSSLAGPWFVGELIDGQMGACFSFGVFVGGSFLQGSMTFVVGILQVSIYKIKDKKQRIFSQGLFSIF